MELARSSPKYRRFERTKYKGSKIIILEQQDFFWMTTRILELGRFTVVGSLALENKHLCWFSLDLCDLVDKVEILTDTYN